MLETLREFAVAMIVTALALMMTVRYWYWMIPERFSVRYLLIMATTISVVLGLYAAFAPR